MRTPWNKGKKLGPQPDWLIKKRVDATRGKKHQFTEESMRIRCETCHKTTFSFTSLLNKGRIVINSFSNKNVTI